jgi:hypothetical protein
VIARDWVELIAAGSIPLAVIALFVNRWHSGKSLGVRAIQTLAVAMFMPAIIILALERVIDGAAVAALVGGVVGYLFANISDYDRRTPSD